MAATVVQSKAVAQNTGLATVAATWDTPATAGNTLLLIVGSDDYRTTTGSNRPESSGFTLPTGCAQETFLGHYVWMKVAAGGETSVNYTIGSASPSCWITAEYSGLEASPYDISAGQLAGSFGDNYTTPTITPTSGGRLIIASIGGSLGAAGLTDLNTWLNSFVEVLDVETVLASGTRDIVGIASNSVTANGATGYSSGATYNVGPDARTGIILAFQVAAGGGASIAPTGITVPVALGSPTLSWAASAAPDGVPVPVTLGAPSLTWSATVAPDGISTPVTIGDPTLTWSGSIAPDGIAVPVDLGAPIVGAVAVAPDGISIPLALGDPGLSWSGSAAPDGIGIPVTLGAPTLTLAGVAPDGISIPVALGSPTLTWSGAVGPDGISVPVTLGAPGVNMPGTRIIRPNTGTTSRPSTATVTRPNTGIVSRP